MNMIVMTHGVATMEFDFGALELQTLFEVRLKENLADFLVADEPI